MRDIKFRAWDNDDKFMRDWHDLLLHRYAQPGDSIFNDIDLELMQFTGLLDKNGKEIYEGDILSDDTFVSKVRFSVDRYISEPISWKDGVSNLNLWLLKRSKAGCPVSVIGNTHENPELLEA